MFIPKFRPIFLPPPKQICDVKTIVNSPFSPMNTCNFNSPANPSNKKAGKEKGPLLGPPVAGAEHPVGVDELQPLVPHELGGLEAAPLLAEEEEEVPVGCRTGLAVSRP